MFIRVDLPEPEGPMMATNSLRRMVMSTPRSARTTSPPMSYSRARLRITITASAGTSGGSRAIRSAVVVRVWLIASVR